MSSLGRSAEETRVVVCGSGFGQQYLTALRLDGRPIAGLVARGSARSREVAERFGVPLVARVDDLESPPHVGCVATGSDQAAAVAEALFAVGADVLAEHPLRAATLDVLLELARRADRRLHVAVLWSRLPHPRTFIDHCVALRRILEPIAVRCAFSPRLAYSLCDVLVAAFDDAALEVVGSTLRSIDGNGTQAQTTSGKLAGCSVMLDAVYVLDDVDNGSDAMEGFTIDVVFSEGKLSLLSPRGPIVWVPHIGRSVHPALEGALRSDAPVCLAPPPLGRDEGRMGRWRAIIEEVDVLRAIVPPPHQSGLHLRAVAASWEHLVDRQAPRLVVREARAAPSASR